MSWHQKSPSKEAKAYCDLMAAQGLLQIVALQIVASKKGKMSVKDVIEITVSALKLTASGVCGMPVFRS